MLTYSFADRGERPLYEHLYACIAHDIQTGAIAPDEKLPSKRGLAKHLGVSAITVEGAYAQLIAEGYVYAIERKGYYAADLSAAGTLRAAPAWGKAWTYDEVREVAIAEDADVARVSAVTSTVDEEDDASGVPSLLADFRGGAQATGSFPYHAWAKQLRAALSEESEESLVAESFNQGSLRLRRALCRHLRQSRGMSVKPEQVVIGAGAQFLYNLVIQLLGHGSLVAVEDPGYPRLTKIYQSNGLALSHVPLDAEGIDMARLRESGANLVHVMPSHQFPTGLVTSVKRRYELLAWAAEDPARIILEDDYDCEFRLAGRPIPALASIDSQGQVIYANTFTKSLGAGFRVGYLVLPPALVPEYQRRLGFYSCTVSVIDQLALARLIEQGDHERHVNRMRNQCRDVRDQLLAALRAARLPGMRIEAQDSGLHFLLGVASSRSEEEIAACALELGVGLLPLGRFSMAPETKGTTAREGRWFVMSYAGLDPARIPAVVSALEAAAGVAGEG